MSRLTRNILITSLGLAGLYCVMKVVACKKSEPADIDDDNPYLTDISFVGVQNSSADSEVHGKRSESKQVTVSLYESKFKPIIDQIFSFFGLIILFPLYAIIALAIEIDDPGPVFFTQKRVGKNKRFFFCHKFRSMKMSAPNDVPTHQLSNPESYITRVGRVLRRTSLDELPQIWDIFRRRMSVIGPRPALWNQNDLILEREKYDANSVLPGLTGLAQIHGRDELEIIDKARVDGEYTRVLRNRGGLLMDIKCFFGTIKSVLKHDGVVEGGTGELHKIHTK